MKKLNKKVLAGAGLGAVALVGGSFAYYNQTVSLENPLNTGHYKNEFTEEFTPPTDELYPGATIDKVVGAKNTGDYPVLVRVKMAESWKREGTQFIGMSTTELDENDKVLFAINEEGLAEEFVAGTNQVDHNDVAGAIDGEYESDASVVRKNMSDNDNWVYNENDGYWYYTRILEPAIDDVKNPDDTSDETGALLDSITLASDIDLGSYITKDYYAVGAEEMTPTVWTEYSVTRDGNGTVSGISIGGVRLTDRNGDKVVDAIDMADYLETIDQLDPDDAEKDTLYRKNESLLDDSKPGYSDANYTLTVSGTFVQATPAAIVQEFGRATNLPQAIQDIISDLEEELTVELTSDAAGA